MKVDVEDWHRSEMPENTRVLARNRTGFIAYVRRRGSRVELLRYPGRSWSLAQVEAWRRPPRAV